MEIMPCIVCGDKNKERILKIRDYHYSIPGEYQVSHCNTCGLLQLDPMPTPEELAGRYSSAYPSYQPARKFDWKRKLAQKIWRGTIPTHNPSFDKPGDFLDVGCANGFYVQKMKDAGWNAKGVEPGDEGVKSGRAAGLDIFHGTLHDAHFPDNSFDYVRLNHSFEHILNPVEVLQEIFRVLRPGGKCYIGVPNVDSILYRIFGGYWWYTGPLHTYGYSPSTLSKLLERTGFKVDHVYFNSNYASIFGSLQIYVHRKQLTGPASEGPLLNNWLLRIIGTWTARLLDLFHQGDAMEILSTKPANPA